MQPKTLWNQRLGMLMACASPGSALAYHLGEASLKANLMHRTKHLDSPAATLEAGFVPAATNGEAKAPGARPTPAGLFGWLRRAFARFEAWSWQREMRERERYLAQAQNVYDLETRMRELDRDIFFSRARTLR